MHVARLYGRMLKSRFFALLRMTNRYREVVVGNPLQQIGIYKS